MTEPETPEVKEAKEGPPGFSWSALLPYLVVASIPLGLYLPLLGTQGLWDPWETHYAEVARRILVDGDWITLRWHDELFFSKPVFLFWTMAASFKVFGVSEWAARLPVVLFSTAGVTLVFHYAKKLFSLWPAAAAACVLACTPYWAMISRQAMTDMEFVAPVSVAILALGYTLIRPEASRWHAYLAYFLCAVATLAKGILGFALPGAVFFVLIVISGRWVILRRARLLEGTAIFCVVTLPWYLAVSIIHGKAFLYEFFFLHHIARVGGGVHGERGTFEYFIPQVGWGMFAWIIVLLPAFVHFLKRVREGTKAQDLEAVMKNLLVAVWAVGAFALFTIARTKFHHYIFPVVIPMAVMIAVWGMEKIRGKVESWEKVAVLFGCLFAVLLARDVIVESDRMTFLFTYAYDRPVGLIQATGWAAVATLVAFSAAGLVFVFSGAAKVKKTAAACALCAAACFALYLLHGHMPAAALHISQKESFDLWHGHQKEGDRFYNWKMNWRGEIYYSKDTIKKVSRLEQLRPVLSAPGRYFIISTIERYRQLDLEIKRIRGKRLKQYNTHDSRYGFGMYDGPVLKPVPDPPLVKAVADNASEVSVSMGESLLELVGYRVGAPSVKIGYSFVVTLYWKAIRKTNERWIVFIHGEKYHDGEAKRFNGNHVAGEGFYATEKWRPGTIIEDTFAVCVDYENPPGLYDLTAGLYREKERLPVDEQWKHDGHNRIPIGRIEVER